MIVVAGDDAQRLACWSFLQRHGVEIPRSEDFQAIARLGSSGILGVVGYNGFCGRVCSMHMAGDGNWISREFIKRAFHYPFRQLNLVAVMAPVAETNTRAIELDKKFGFKEVHRVEKGWGDSVDLVVLQLKREDCKWLLKLELLDEAANRLAA